MTEKDRHQREDLIKRYFALLNEIQGGAPEAVDKILELWDEDGVCTFTGVPPLSGEFRGEVALRSLYQGIARSTSGPERKISKALATEVEVTEPRVRGDKAVVFWDSRIEAEKGRSFTLNGSNTFHLKNGRIARLEIVVSPRPSDAKGFRIEQLAVQDIGRLAMAAWAVV